MIKIKSNNRKCMRMRNQNVRSKSPNYTLEFCGGALQEYNTFYLLWYPFYRTFQMKVYHVATRNLPLCFFSYNTTFGKFAMISELSEIFVVILPYKDSDIRE